MRINIKSRFRLCNSYLILFFWNFVILINYIVTFSFLGIIILIYYKNTGQNAITT